ncbi:MAG: 3-hydroxybutyryl-CoA dehydrogenase [Halanaerobium sp.]|nr:3-hydroxybutyryl-CoA dehydrogenase [Halanaerobium sp.]
MKIKTVGIIGAGTMGMGIAQTAAAAGYQVLLRDIKEEYLERCRKNIDRSLQRLVKKGRLEEGGAAEIIGRISYTIDLEDFARVDFVIEAVSENMEIKQKIYPELDRICAEDVILASNTSGLSISEMASATGRPGQVVGMHFFNPVPVMKLVEVIKGAHTTDETVQKTCQLAESIGKETIEVEESPLFTVNRILVPMINEAIFVLMNGIASVEDIDKGMRLGANHPIGPLALADLIGLDVLLDIIETLYRETGDSKYRPCPLLKKKVRAGLLGRKSGQGFYNYN